MGKKKTAVKEPDNHVGDAVTKLNGNIVLDEVNKRPIFGCSAFVISIILVTTLSILIGLIFVELNASEKDFKTSQERYYSEKIANGNKKVPKDDDMNKNIPVKPEEVIDATISEAPILETIEATDFKTMEKLEQPLPKKTKQEDMNKKVAKDVPKKELKHIEDDIISDIPSVSKKKENEPKQSESLGKDQEGESALKQKPSSDDKNFKEQQVGLEELYLEVETIAEGILKEDPENLMVKQLAPHLEGVLKDLESGKLSGLRDSLLHIKLILLDLKERLEESRKKTVLEKPHSQAKAEIPSKKPSGKVPVEEVIPDPVYIAPLGNEALEKPEKLTEKDVKEKEGQEFLSQEKKLPVVEVIPEPVYIAPRGESEEQKMPKKDEETRQQTDRSKKEVSSTDKERKSSVDEGTSDRKQKSVDESKKDNARKPSSSAEKSKDNDGKRTDNIERKEREIPPTGELKKQNSKVKETQKVQEKERKDQPAFKESNKNEMKPQITEGSSKPEKEEPLKTPEGTAKSKQSPSKNKEPKSNVDESSKERASEVKNAEKHSEKPDNIEVEKKETKPENKGKAEIEENSNKAVPIEETKRKESKPTAESKKVVTEVDQTKTGSEAKNKPPYNNSPPSTRSVESSTINTEESRPLSGSTPKGKNEQDIKIQKKLDTASTLVNEKPSEALIIYESLLQEWPRLPQGLLGRAKALDKLAETEKSNSRLEQCISAYEFILNLADEIEVPKDIIKEAGLRCADRMNFRGMAMWKREVKVLERLTSAFSFDVDVLNQVGLFYLLMNMNSNAKKVFEKGLQVSPANGFTLVHLGFILKVESKSIDELEEAASYMQEGLKIGGEGTRDSRFYHHLGDAYQRLGFEDDAYKVYDAAVALGLFPNRYQRSQYNVEKLKSQPIWSLEETTYAQFFRKLQRHWKEIKNEGIKVLEMKEDLKSQVRFKEDLENLEEKGRWSMFDLFVRGKKNANNCIYTPITCSLIEEFTPAANCKRGQSKFSVMEPGTHIYPHTGPTNCRLRSHLGLVTPEGAHMRVVNETLTWEQGKIIVFDDSFEHEVWHKGNKFRLILIVDVWHPELTEDERNTLRPI